MIKKIIFLFVSCLFCVSCGNKNESDDSDLSHPEEKTGSSVDSVMLKESLAFRDTIVALCNPTFESVTNLFNVTARFSKQQLGAENFDLTIQDVRATLASTRQKVKTMDSCCQTLPEYDEKIRLKRAVHDFCAEILSVLDTDFPKYIKLIEGTVTKKDHPRLKELLVEIQGKTQTAEANLDLVSNEFDDKYRIYE